MRKMVYFQKASNLICEFSSVCLRCLPMTSTQHKKMTFRPLEMDLDLMDADKEGTLDAIAIALVRPTSVLPDDVQMRLYKADGGAEDVGAKRASMTAKGAGRSRLAGPKRH